MIRYPMILAGSHPAAQGIFGEDVYVEARVAGPTVGFAAFGKDLWVDMPIGTVEKLNDKELNPQFHYVGILTESGSIVLTDILTRRGPLDHEAKFVEADRLGFECIQLFHAGAVTEPQQLQDFLQQSPTGIVLKPMQPGPQGRLVYVEITPDMFGPQIVTPEGACQTADDSHAPAQN